MKDLERVKRLLGSYNHDPEYAELYQALVGVIADAERYRFIRDSTPEQFDQFEPGLYSGGDELDKLTDAAMAGANG